MQKDEIWELKPEKDDSGTAGGEKGDEDRKASGAPEDKGPGGAGETPEETPKKKEPDRIDMDEILDLKPDEEGAGEPPGGKKKEELELIDIGDKKPDAEQESVVPARQEEKSVSMEKPQVLEPDKAKKEKGKPEELQGGPVKRYERAPKVRESAAPARKSKLLTIGLFVVLIFIASSAALLALPFFGIETIPDELPVIGQIIEFYRNLPVFPD